MVLMSLDFYELKNRIKKEITKRIEEISADTHPVDFSWLMYALQLEEDDPTFLEKVKELKRWAYSENSGKNDRDLGALSLCLYFLKDEKEESLEILVKKVRSLTGKNMSRPFIRKPNVLNDRGRCFVYL